MKDVVWGYNDGTARGAGAVHAYADAADRDTMDPRRHRAVCGYRGHSIPAHVDESPHCKRCDRILAIWTT